MKVGSAVLGLHIAVVCVFALTQGCVTTESEGIGRGVGARHKGPWKPAQKSKSAPLQNYVQGSMEFDTGDDTAPVFDSIIVEETAPAAPVAPSWNSGSAGTTETYIVQKGDILSQLAVDFDTTVQTLVQLNGLSNPDVLYVGQELAVPAGRRGSKPVARKRSPSIKKGGSYEIQKGDTLSEIAIAAGVSIDDLRSVNNIKGDQIFAGEKINIPSYGKVPSTTRRSTSKKKAAPAPEQPQAAEPTPAPVVEAPALAPLAPAESAVTPVESSMSVGMVQDHLVYPGESLDDIARQYGALKSEIMRMNGITDETAILEGQRLRIPITE